MIVEISIIFCIAVVVIVMFMLSNIDKRLNKKQQFIDLNNEKLVLQKNPSLRRLKMLSVSKLSSDSMILFDKLKALRDIGENKTQTNYSSSFNEIIINGMVERNKQLFAKILSNDFVLDDNDLENILEVPILFCDFNASIINLQDFLLKLIAHFEFHQLMVDVSIDAGFNQSLRSSFLEIPTSEAVIFQIIISIVHNLNYLSTSKSPLIVKIIKETQNTVISISLDSSILQREDMIKYTNKIMYYTKNVFILNMRQVFDNLECHKIKYSISNTSKNANVVNIYIPDNLEKGNAPKKYVENVVHIPKKNS